MPCSPSTPSSPPSTPPPSPLRLRRLYPPRSQSFPVHLQSPKYESRRKACPRSQPVRSCHCPQAHAHAHVCAHTTFADLSCVQSSVREEPEVATLLPIAHDSTLTSPQLQRHPRGALRPLRQVRPCAVRRPPLSPMRSLASNPSARIS